MICCRDTERDGKGYFEDRRPASNMDPYVVTTLLCRVSLGGRANVGGGDVAVADGQESAAFSEQGDAGGGKEAATAKKSKREASSKKVASKTSKNASDDDSGDASPKKALCGGCIVA